MTNDPEWTTERDAIVEELGVLFAGKPIELVLHALAHVLLVGVVHLRTQKADEVDVWTERYCSRLGHLVSVIGDCPVEQIPAVMDGTRTTH